MSLRTVSIKKGGRVYHRHFDHDEARALHAQGRSYGCLAEHFGVSAAAVARVCDPKVRERMAAQSKEWARRQRRAPCKGGCGRLVWFMNRQRSGYCTRCAAGLRAATTSDVAPDRLRCTQCREWKPDAEYGTAHGALARRGHDSECRSCSAARRRAYRRDHPEQTRAEYRRLVENRRREKEMARYIVFQPNGDGFREMARVDAGSPAHAVEQAATEAGEYVAVLEGRFKLMTVKPVQALRVVTSDAA